MKPLTKLVLDLLLDKGLEGKPLVEADVLRQLPESIRNAETTLREVRTILKHFAKQGIATKTKFGFKSTRYRNKK